MGLKTGKPPEEVLEIVSEAVYDLTDAHGARIKGIEAYSREPQLTAPLQVFTLGLEDILEGSLEMVREASWRYLLMQENEPFAAAEVDSNIESEIRFSHFNTGPFVGELARTILQAEELTEVREDDYEARILKIPALYVMALWLNNSEENLIIPMPPTNEYLIPKRIYTPEEFFEVLREPAKISLDFDNSPEAE